MPEIYNWREFALAGGLMSYGPARLAHEVKEAREQQVATADVLKVISRSPTHRVAGAETNTGRGKVNQLAAARL